MTLANGISIRGPPSSVIESQYQHDSLVLLQVDEQEIDRLISGLRSDCAIGWDGISSRILQRSKYILVPAITHICQLAMDTGLFPNSFKKAIVHPIFKGGKEDEVTNYRPISVLTALSKILEKVLNNRLVNFLESRDILARNQFGFRKGISTEHAVSSLVEDVVGCLDAKDRCLGIFIDLSKAFDTVSIPMLLKKLEHIGVRGVQLSLFKDYLTSRKQSVRIGDFKSDEEELVFGVPQGSILGPTLFLIYINSLCKLVIPNCNIYAYADDTALIVNGPNWKDTCRYAETALSTVVSWFNSNLLTINLKKTSFITFALNTSSLPAAGAITIKAHTCLTNPISGCQCLELSRSTTTKYLGLNIDQHLKWDKHIHSLIPRIRKLIHIFKNLNSVTDLKTLKTVYFALCQSVLSYCITVWGGAAKYIMLPLERAQRAVLKVMTKKPFRYPTLQVYNDNSVLTVRQLFIMLTILRKHSQLPFDPSLLIRKRRSDRVCHIPQHRTALAGRHFKILSSKMYNKINKILQIYRCTKRKTKQKLQEWLKTLTYTTTEDILIQES